MRNDTKSSRNGVRRRTTTPAADAASAGPDLLSIPRLGCVRAESLAAAGVNTLADLRKMSLEDLAKIKWIGMGNARLIKQWLDTQTDGAAPDVKPAARRAPRTRATAAEKPTPAPRATKSSRAAAPKPADTPKPPRPAATRSTTSTRPKTNAANKPADDELDPFNASTAEISIKADTLTDDVVRVDSAVVRIKEAIPKKSREKKLGRQLKKVAQSVADLPQSTDVMPANDKEAASEALDRIANLLNKAVETGKLSAKKQEAMGAELKKFRKRLEKALGG